MSSEQNRLALYSFIIRQPLSHRSPLEIASKIKPAIWQSTMNKMIAYKVHLSFFVIGLGLTPEAAWMDLDKQIKPMTIATIRRFIYSPFLYRFSAFFAFFMKFTSSRHRIELTNLLHFALSSPNFSFSTEVTSPRHSRYSTYIPASPS